MRDVSKSISEHIEPKIYPVVEQVDVDGKQCIKVQVAGNEHPYYMRMAGRISV
jgi:ATP-dependent DNA helicase RecG